MECGGIGGLDEDAATGVVDVELVLEGTLRGRDMDAGLPTGAVVDAVGCDAWRGVGTGAADGSTEGVKIERAG